MVAGVGGEEVGEEEAGLVVAGVVVKGATAAEGTGGGEVDTVEGEGAGDMEGGTVVGVGVGGGGDTERLIQQEALSSVLLGGGACFRPRDEGWSAS